MRTVDGRGCQLTTVDATRCPRPWLAIESFTQRLFGAGRWCTLSFFCLPLSRRRKGVSIQSKGGLRDINRKAAPSHAWFREDAAVVTVAEGAVEANKS